MTIWKSWFPNVSVYMYMYTSSRVVHYWPYFWCRYYYYLIISSCRCWKASISLPQRKRPHSCCRYSLVFFFLLFAVPLPATRGKRGPPNEEKWNKIIEAWFDKWWSVLYLHVYIYRKRSETNHLGKCGCMWQAVCVFSVCPFSATVLSCIELAE